MKLINYTRFTSKYFNITIKIKIIYIFFMKYIIIIIFSWCKNIIVLIYIKKRII